jgi:hypothetical protein
MRFGDHTRDFPQLALRALKNWFEGLGNAKLHHQHPKIPRGFECCGWPQPATADFVRGLLPPPTLDAVKETGWLFGRLLLGGSLGLTGRPPGNAAGCCVRLFVADRRLQEPGPVAINCC